MSRGTASQRALAAIVVVALGAVAAAVVSQHVFGMLPCPWCVLQRLIFVLIALAALLGLLSPGAIVQRIGAALALALALGGAAAALWQHFVASASVSCNQTLADRIVGATQLDRQLPELFAAYASCGDAQVTLFGLPYEFYSLALFIALSVAALRALRRR